MIDSIKQNLKQINLIDFEEQLRYSLIQQVAYARTILEKGEKLFGKQTVDDAVDANKEFLNSIAEAIESIVSAKGSDKQSTNISDKKSGKPAQIPSSKLELKPKRGKHTSQNSRPSFLRLLDENANYNRS